MNRADSWLPEANPRKLRLASSTLGPADGRPLLVLHGITCSRRYWTPRILPLARRYRLLIPDLPGFGRSPKPYVNYDLEFFCEAIRGFLEQRGLANRPLPIISHSLGSLLSLEISARFPAQVERLVLMSLPRFACPDTAHRVMMSGSSSYRSLMAANSVGASVAQMRRTGWRLTARYVRRLPWSVLADSRKFTFRSLTSTLERCLLHHRVDATLDRCPPALPTLMIHGELDQAAPLESVRDLPARAPYPELRVIAGAGHHPFHTHTSECLRLIDDFLNGN